MIPPFWENGSGAGGGFRKTPTQWIDSGVQPTGAYGDVQLPVGAAIPTDVQIFDGTSVSLPTVVPEEIKTRKAISKEPSPEYEREFGCGSHGYQREEASVEKAARTPDYTRTRLRREPHSSTPYLLQSEPPQTISSLSSGGTSIAGFASGNSGQNQHLFSAAASPPLILAFLAVGLFTLSMIGVFGWRRVQYTRGLGRADLAWLGAGGVRGLGGTVVGVDGRESKDGPEVKVRPKLWDLWTSTGNSEEDLKRAKRKGKRRSEYENQEKEDSGMTWGDIMPISVRIIAPPPKPDTPSTIDGKKKKKKHGKSKKRKSRPVSGVTATTAETTAEPTTTAAESAQADSPPTTASSRFTLFRIPLRIHRWARRKYFRRSPPPAPALTPQPSNTSDTTNIPNPNRTSSDSASGRESNPDIALSPLQRVARSENAQPWADWRTVELPRSRPSGSGSRSPRRSSDRTRPSPNHASSSNATSNSQANGADGGGAAEEEDPYLNDLDKQLEREGLERCPITGMIVEKRDGIVGDIRNGIRKRQRRREGRGAGGGSRKEKERARVQVAVAIVMPTPQAARARRVQEALTEEKPMAIEARKKRRKRRRKVKQTEVPVITIEEKNKVSAHIATQDTPAPAQPDATVSEPASLHPRPATTLSPTPPSSTPNPSRPPTRMTLTSDAGSLRSYVTAPDDNVSGGEKTPTRAQLPELQPSPAQREDVPPPVDAQPSPAEAPTDSPRVDASSQSPEGGAEDLESEYEEYTDSDSESDSDPAPSRPVLINFGSKEENRRREETARQIVYAFGLYECQWRLSSSASRSRHKESLKAIGVQVAGSQSGLASSTSGSGSGSGYSTGSASVMGTGTSSSEASSGRNSGVASPREALPGPGRIRAVGWGRRI